MRGARRSLLVRARNVDVPGAVAQVALDVLGDRRHRVRAEGQSARGVEAVDRRDQAEIGDVVEVLARVAGRRVALRQRPRERHEPQRQLLACAPVATRQAVKELPARVARAGERRIERLRSSRRRRGSVRKRSSSNAGACVGEAAALDRSGRLGAHPARRPICTSPPTVPDPAAAETGAGRRSERQPYQGREAALRSGSPPGR